MIPVKYLFEIADFSPLLSVGIEKLDFSFNEAVEDISFVYGCPQLQHLRLNGCPNIRDKTVLSSRRFNTVSQVTLPLYRK